MKVDQAIEESKPLGRSQMVILVAAVLMNIQTGFTMLGNVFLAKNPPYHCANHSGYSLEESIPFTDGVFSTCLAYSYPGSGDNQTTGCTRWKFDTSVAGKSIVSEWSLVCGKDVLPRLSQTMVLAGFAVGSVFGGPIADRYGRRPTILVALVLFNALGLSVSLVKSYAAFAILRFLVGAIFKAVRIPIMNLLFESLVPRHRPLFGMIPTCLVSGGLMIMAGIAYLFRDWRYLNIVLMIPTVVIMAFSWFIPESVRWLVSRKRHEKAEEVMQKIASFNKAKGFPPSPVLNDNEEEKQTAQTETGFRVFLQLFKSPTLTVTLILCWNWVTCTLTYFGFALSTGSLAGNQYLNFFISSSADLVGIFTVTMLLKRFGTPRLLIFGLASASLTMIVIIILDYTGDKTSIAYKVLLTSFSILGRLVISFAIQPCILMTSDLFPTPVRNTGTAIVHLIGNIGSFCSPLLLYANKYISSFASMVTVCFCVVATCLSFLLPETVGTIQPATPADLQKMFDNNRIFKFGKRQRKQEDNNDVIM